jgi:hypothetical protein
VPFQLPKLESKLYLFWNHAFSIVVKKGEAISPLPHMSSWHSGTTLPFVGFEVFTAVFMKMILFNFTFYLCHKASLGLIVYS